jgi:CRISPR/Cas system-associated exonuclease Cas4 (RecB family)
MKTKPLESVEERVTNMMPSGIEYQLPEGWAAKFSAMDIRKESPSSLVNFLTCPLKWFVERHSGMPPKDEIVMAALVGTFVHRILEVFYSEPAHLRTEDLLMETFEVAWEELTKGDGTDGIVPAEVMRDFEKLQSQVYAQDAQRGRFYKIAQDCLLATWDFDGDPAELEVLSNEGWIKGEQGCVRITGRIDRTIKGPGATEIIQDYKTGKAPVLEKDEGPDVEFLPLKVKSIQLLYMAHMKRFTLNVTPELLHTMDTLVSEVVKAMDEVADTGKIIAVPTDSVETPPCRWCPIVDICPAWSDEKPEDAMADLEDFVAAKISEKKKAKNGSKTTGR